MATSIDLGIREPDEKQPQDAHREAELFINAVPSILISLDSQGLIKRWNDAAARTFGLGKAEVLGKTLASCGIKWQTEGIESTIRELMRSGQKLSLDDIRFEMHGCSRILGMNVNWIKLT